MNKPPGHLPLTCELDQGVLDGKQRGRYTKILQEMQGAVRDIKELTDGYTFCFPMEPSLFLNLAEFITLEHLCCAFFDFALELESRTETVWLRITGSEEAKKLLKTELGTLGIIQNNSDRF